MASRARLKGMSRIAYRRRLTGVLKRVVVVVLLTGALRKVAVVVLLGFVGLTAGVMYGALFPPSLGATIVMPAKSSYTFPSRFRPAPVLVRLMRGHHPGVRVVAHGERVIELSPKPLSDKDKWFVCYTARRHCDDYTAHRLALHKVVSGYLLGNAGRPYKVIWHGTAGRLPYGPFGLLAGLSAALVFLSPRLRRRYRASRSWEPGQGGPGLRLPVVPRQHQLSWPSRKDLSTLTGVLKRVVVVVLLGFVGLTAGVAYGMLNPGHEMGETLMLTADSPHSASDLVTITRNYHPGVRAVAQGRRVIDLSVARRLSAYDIAFVCPWAAQQLYSAPVRLHYPEKVEVHRPFVNAGPPLCWGDTARIFALTLATTSFIRADDGKFKVIFHGTAGRLPYGLFGLLAGLSAALGFLVPPRSRVTAVH